MSQRASATGSMHHDFLVRVVRCLDGLVDAAEFATLQNELRDDHERQQLYLQVCMQRRIMREDLARRGIMQTPAAECVQWLNDDQNDASAQMAASLMDEVLEAEHRAAERRAHEEALERARQQHEARERYERLALLQHLPSEVVPVRHVVIPRFVFYGTLGGVAALVLIALYAVFHQQQPAAVAPSPSLATVAPAPVAMVAESVNARWADESLSTAPRTALYPGTLTLRQGLVRFIANSGAQVIVEAPATFELVNANRIVLHQGKLVGDVPEKAIGFNVITPSANVIDLGTEFGVAVDSMGGTEVHVYEGKVSLRPRDVEPHRTTSEELLGGEARHVNASGSSTRRIPTDPLRFVRRDEFEASVQAQHSAYHRWRAFSYTLRRHPDLVAYYDFELDETQPNRLINTARVTHGTLNGSFEGLAGLPEWTTGRWREKHAVAFDHHRRAMVRVPYESTLDLDGEVTIALWVLMRDLDRSQHLLTQRQLQPRSDSLNFVWNGTDKSAQQFTPHATLFSTGIGTIETYRNLFVPAPQVRPFQWTHLAVTYSPQGTRHYVNGQETGRIPGHTTISRSKADLLIGGVERELYENETLQGAIDELIIFRRALSDKEIRELYEQGKPN